MNEQSVDLSQYFGVWSVDPHRGQSLANALRVMDWNTHFAASAKKMEAGQLDGQSRPYQVKNSVAVVNINGVMTKGGSSLAEDGSTIRIRQQVRKAARDDQVSAILLVIDSPGGTVAGTADLADEVRQANASKPVIAFVEDLCASAAYYVASQASEIHVNQPDAWIGSIGTYMVVYDMSKAFEKEGIKTHVLASGPLKGAGEPGSEITQEQLDNWQGLVDKAQKSFASAVKLGRNLNAEQLASVTTGGVWSAIDAKKNQLIDAISSFDEALSRAASVGKKKGRTMSAESESAPRGATLAELKTIGATSDFVIQQLDKGATLADAKNAWLDQRAAALDKRDETLKAKEAEADKRQKALDDAEAKAKVKPGGLKTVKDPDPNANSEGGTGDAESQFQALVSEKIKAGVPRERAVSEVVKENKELHQRMLEEAPRRSGNRA